jgi:hypothetical protein
VAFDFHLASWTYLWVFTVLLMNGVTQWEVVMTEFGEEALLRPVVRVCCTVGCPGDGVQGCLGPGVAHPKVGLQGADPCLKSNGIWEFPGDHINIDDELAYFGGERIACPWYLEVARKPVAR